MEREIAAVLENDVYRQILRRVALERRVEILEEENAQVVPNASKNPPQLLKEMTFSKAFRCVQAWLLEKPAAWADEDAPCLAAALMAQRPSLRRFEIIKAKRELGIFFSSVRLRENLNRGAPPAGGEFGCCAPALQGAAWLARDLCR